MKQHRRIVVELIYINTSYDFSNKKYVMCNYLSSELHKKKTRSTTP